MEQDHLHTFETLELTNQFVTRAIGIFVAYSWSQFFVRCLGSVWISEPNPAKWTANQNLGPYCIWFILVMMIGPMVKTSLAPYKHKGGKSLSFGADFCQLLECSVNTIIGWGFKDVCLQALGCIPDTPTEFPEEWGGLGKSLKYSAFVLVVSIAATAICAAVMILLKILSKDNNKSYSHQSLAAPPFLVGVGLCWARLGQSLYWFYPGTWVPDNAPYQDLVANFIVHSTLTVLFSNVVVEQVNSYQTWLTETADIREHDVYKMTLFQFAENEFTRIFYLSMSFAYAWTWHLFLKRVFFRVGFNCQKSDFGVPQCPDGVDTFFLNLTYAILLSAVALSWVPKLKAEKANLMRINRMFIDTFMVHDHNVLRHKKAAETLGGAFFGVALGKAYVHIAQITCSLRLTPECPADMKLLSFDTFKYALVCLAYTALATFIYHLFMEGQRFNMRTLMVIGLEDGTCDRILRALDKDKDGSIDRNELKELFEGNGLDAAPFSAAFDQLDAKDGTAGDGLVSAQDFEKELIEVMKSLKLDFADLSKQKAEAQKSKEEDAARSQSEARPGGSPRGA